MTGYLISLVAAWTMLAGRQGAGQAESITRPESRPRFTGEMSLRGAADTPAQPLKVTLVDWVIRNRQTLTLTTRGMLVVQLRAGDAIAATINGQRTERKDGEYFTVPADATLSIQTGNDTAVLTVLEVQR